MFGFSEKTAQWILGFIGFNLLVSLYIYTFFYQEWLLTLSSVVLPILVWEILIFGILAPDDVFQEIFGENGSSNGSIAPRTRNPEVSVRAVIVSSGDH